MSNDATRNWGGDRDAMRTAADMTDRKSLRISVILLLVGMVLSLVVGSFHPGRENPNDHSAVFSEYAASAPWTVVHLGQFAAFAVIIAGFAFLYYGLNVPASRRGWPGHFGAVSAAISLGLYGVLQAVDGVTLKRTVDALANAPATEQAARFASAEAIRWVEEGVRSYQSFFYGLALLFFAVEIVIRGRVPRPVGFLLGLTGVSYLAQGWFLGEGGFSSANGLAQLPGYAFFIAAVIWLLVSTIRTREIIQATA
jgi:hypothetical protein